jgi:ATP-binding cassette subfamily F protein 3
MAQQQEGPELTELLHRYDRVNAQFIAAGGHGFETRLSEILSGLGFTEADGSQILSTMSGGQKCRAALAKLLLEDKPLLLMDEPTNHLDIDAVRWLERFLSGHRGGAVVISHDRYLLDRICSRIIEVANKQVYSYPGNYSNFAETKERRLLTEKRQMEKDEAFIKKERAFIAKHLSGQRTSEAKGRRTRLERRLKGGEFVTEKTKAHRTAGISFDNVDPQRATGPTLVRGDELSMSFGDKTLFTDLSFQLPVGDRLDITGPNGTVKTTLLRIMLGQQVPVSGTMEFEGSPDIGSYSQDHNEMETSRTVLEEMRACDPGLSEEQARAYLGRFLFTGNDAFKPISKLSGGEQSRVRLATLIRKAPDVLVLDEPTNHLDIPSCEALEQALAEFPGTVIAVSHDRYFLDRITTRLLVIRPEGCTRHTGNYSSYIEWLESKKTQSADTQTKTAKKKQRKRDSQSKKLASNSQYDHRSIEDIEALVIEHEEKLALLHERFNEPEVYRDPETISKLRAEATEIESSLAELDRVWQERAGSQ